jgi:hypothetical protein
MQQTALNLMAIAIFAMTLCVLLGPLLNLSPFVPAATTLAILGLATLDSLSWKGRGMTLLLDSLSPSQYRQRVVHHEAGHFLAAYLLGIPVTGYTLTAWEAFKQGYPGLGGVRFDTAALLEQKQDFREISLILERFCTVWMAGIAAEKLVYGQAQGGDDDRDQLREALRGLGLSESASQQKERWALLQAKNLLERHRASYEALVKAMENRASIADCHQAIGVQADR